MAARKEKGKLSARRTGEVLLDKGSFREVDALMVHRETNFRDGQEEISGR